MINGCLIGELSHSTFHSENNHLNFRPIRMPLARAWALSIASAVLHPPNIPAEIRADHSG